MRGDKKKFSWRKLSFGTNEIAGETTNDRELPERTSFAGFNEIPFSDFEQAVAEQQFALRFDQLRLYILEIDALNRLLNVQIPLPGCGRICTIPIEGPVSRIAVLLDFDDQIAFTYRMNTAGWEENGI